MNELKKLRENIDKELGNWFRPHPDYIYNENATSDFLNSIMQLITTYTDQKELEARIEIIGVIDDKVTDCCCDNCLSIIRCYLDQLSSQLTNNKKGIEK